MPIPSDQSGIVAHADIPPSDVLVVDDEPSTVALFSHILTGAGHRVVSATNGVEAMQALLTNGMQLVITDWSMPEMDGIELCRAIREHEGIPFAYILMVTGRNLEPTDLVTAFEAGADDFLHKPVNRVELLARLRAAERIIRLQGELNARNRDAFRHNAKMEIINTQLGDANAKLHRMATTDELTGLTNRREAMTQLAREWASAARHDHPLAIVSLDIDRFKNCNDVYGHAVGDEVLRSTAKTLHQTVRTDDVVGRVGGEEFLVICPHTTEAMAAAGAERIRAACQAQVIRSGELTLGATVSAGVAERTSAMTTFDDLMQAADAALYAAKDAGRNIVYLASRVDVQASDDAGSDEIEPVEGVDLAITRAGEERITVLLVDDDASTRSLSRRFLERSGCHVIEARDGVDALSKVDACSPDVIVMDAMMPKMDGLECTRRLKRDPTYESIPVVIASARSDATDVVAGLRAGADEYLAKPINPDELILRVNTLVRLSRELRKANGIRGEQARALGLVHDFTLGIAAADSLAVVLDQTVQTTSALMGCPKVTLLLPDRLRRHLAVARSSGYDPRDLADLRVPIGTAVSGVVFESRESVMVTTAEENAAYAQAPDAALLSEVPSLSIALSVPDGAVGVLNLNGHQTGRVYTPLELKYVELVANIAATALGDRMARRSRDEARHSIVVALAKLAEHRDSDTGRHVERVTQFSCLLAEQLRTMPRYRGVIDDTFMSDLRRAAPLHDIGKVAVPDRILLKPGPLTAEEAEAMRQHASIGEKTLQSVIARVPDASFLHMAEGIAGMHHEWVDGTGYPRGLQREQIPLAARILAVADVYDAVTTERVYKAAMTHERAVAIITESSGAQFDPDVVDAFLDREREIAKLAHELGDDSDPADRPAEVIASVPSIMAAG